MSLDMREVARTKLLTGPSKILVLMYMGAKRKVDFIKAGLGASTIYYNMLFLVEAGLIVKKNGEYVLTEKGVMLAKALLECLLKAKDILGGL
ncbi:transcriptional regulator [Desulfurococcus amylolyticus]|uniref:HTH_DTXR domain containing protein n=1 Tax=Desulfurococcus amylolyticus DSM 16532 TaxID=768672 RepID=I3XSY3_DESAM|nr:transcriptional regulator [Desulfurococcus amylolyticus]AFL67057.1 HTH_DTXR domain containing protein [Desulfurococcus amylolyticus DSM 16532]